MKTTCWMTGLALAMAGPVMADSHLDIAYGDGARQQLDLYLPENVDTPPIVVFVHGGRWFRNDKGQIALYDRITALNEAGIAIASINYTFSDQAIWPAQRDDLRAALTFVRDHADEYGYDNSDMAVWGQSSGAHLALWAAFDQAASGDVALDALISWYAPSDLYQIIPDRAADDVIDRGNLAKEPTPESQLIGAPVPENRALADAASPLKFLETLPEGTALPATLLVHGDQDFVISPLQTERLYDAMTQRAASGPVALRIVEGADHGGDLFNAEVAPVVAFLKDAFND